MPIETFLRNQGIDYIVRRESMPDRTESGLINTEQTTKRAYIGFMPGTDIEVGDILINPVGESVYVIETKTTFFMKKPHELKAYYQTELERHCVDQEPTSVFHIQNAYGSIIGNNNQATVNYNSAVSELKQAVAADSSEDKEQLEKIVSLLEMVVNNQVPPSKGLFSRFSAVMERHSWLSNAVAGAILSWLTSKVP